MRSREEREAACVLCAERKAAKKRARVEAFGNRISPQFMEMTAEERRKLIEANPGMFRSGGG